MLSLNFNFIDITSAGFSFLLSSGSLCLWHHRVRALLSLLAIPIIMDRAAPHNPLLSVSLSRRICFATAHCWLHQIYHIIHYACICFDGYCDGLVSGLRILAKEMYKIYTCTERDNNNFPWWNSSFCSPSFFCVFHFSCIAHVGNAITLSLSAYISLPGTQFDGYVQFDDVVYNNHLKFYEITFLISILF